MTLKDKKGFTLVEVIVTVALLLILAGGGLTFFIVFTREKAEASAYLMAQMQSELIVEEVARKIRESNYILPVETNDPETVTAGLVPHEPIKSDVLFLYRHGETGPWAGFSVAPDSGRLLVHELVNGEFRRFVATGNRPIEIYRENPDSAAFRIWIGSSLQGDKPRQAEINMTIRYRRGNNEFYDLSVERGVFVCRIF